VLISSKSKLKEGLILGAMLLKILELFARKLVYEKGLYFNIVISP